LPKLVNQWAWRISAQADKPVPVKLPGMLVMMSLVMSSSVLVSPHYRPVAIPLLSPPGLTLRLAIAFSWFPLSFPVLF
jgi:hypothetical protein